MALFTSFSAGNACAEPHWETGSREAGGPTRDSPRRVSRPYSPPKGNRSLPPVGSLRPQAACLLPSRSLRGDLLRKWASLRLQQAGGGCLKRKEGWEEGLSCPPPLPTCLSLSLSNWARTPFPPGWAGGSVTPHSLSWQAFRWDICIWGFLKATRSVRLPTAVQVQPCTCGVSEDHPAPSLCRVPPGACFSGRGSPSKAISKQGPLVGNSLVGEEKEQAIETHHHLDESPEDVALCKRPFPTAGRFHFCNVEMIEWQKWRRD